MPTTLISMKPDLVKFLTHLSSYKGSTSPLYIDLEGNRLSRHGTLSLITILVEGQNEVNLVDVTTLGSEAFSIETTDGNTLKKILESEEYIKVIFDVRNDSDALFSLYGVKLSGVEDLQLMELASRSFPRIRVSSLATCIEKDAPLRHAEKENWRKVKARGLRLFDPARGGSYAVFDERPPSREILEYCEQDVAFMPCLRSVYKAGLSDAWWTRVIDETKRRIFVSQQPNYQPYASNKVFGPTAWR